VKLGTIAEYERPSRQKDHMAIFGIILWIARAKKITAAREANGKNNT
jgi:hypothetical protein